jgi:hypothetical protein
MKARTRIRDLQGGKREGRGVATKKWAVVVVFSRYEHHTCTLTSWFHDGKRLDVLFWRNASLRRVQARHVEAWGVVARNGCGTETHEEEILPFSNRFSEESDYTHTRACNGKKITRWDTNNV